MGLISNSLQETIFKISRGYYYRVIMTLIDRDFLRALSNFAITISDLMECLSVCLFASIARLASMSIQSITEEIKTSWQPQRLMKWKQSYCSISILIRAIDECFAGYLLIFFIKCVVVPFLFISSIIFDLTRNETHELNFKAGNCLKYIFLASVVTYEVVRMTNKVSMYWYSTVNKQLIVFLVQALILDKKLNLRLHFNTTLESDVIIHWVNPSPIHFTVHSFSRWET